MTRFSFKKFSVFLVAVLMIISLSACGGGSGSGKKSSSGSTKKTTITYLSNDTTKQSETKVINDLATAYTKKHPNVTFKVNTVQQSNMTQKLQLAASSQSLPNMFKINETSQLDTLIKGKQILNIGSTFKKLGIYKQMNPAAIQIIKRMTGTKNLYAVPQELNIEGFWFNKKIFKDNNLAIPTTWSELLKDSATLKSKGIQPFAVDGKDGWPITRLINAYAVRYYGVNAMDQVAKGKLKLTDPGFVKAAQSVANMAEKGYFGKGVDTVDMNTAVNTFLQGKAAMIYDGSWALSNFNDPSQDKIGVKNIGFFNVPTVQGGKGTLNDYFMNVGMVTTFSKKGYSTAEGNWMKDIYNQYGNAAMAKEGMITGFKVTKMPNNISPLTKETITNINKAKNAALWFEAEMDQKSSQLSQTSVQLLANGSLTPQKFLSQLQQSLDNNKN